MESKFSWNTANWSLGPAGVFLIERSTELAYLKESLILVDKCLTIAQAPEEMIKEQDVRDYMQYSGKAIKLLEGVGKRIGIDFNYSFLNDLQVEVAEDVQPKKSFTQFSGEIYDIR